MTENLVVVAEITARPGKEDELEGCLLALVEPTRKEEGCLAYTLHRGAAEPGTYVFYEIWTSPEALDRHMETPHFGAFREAAGELLAAPARVLRIRRIA